MRLNKNLKLLLNKRFLTILYELIRLEKKDGHIVPTYITHFVLKKYEDVSQNHLFEFYSACHDSMHVTRNHPLKYFVCLHCFRVTYISS